MAVIFAEIGQEVHIVDGNFEAAVNKGVSLGYTDGLLRKSVVRDPFYDRVNTDDNTPAIIHTKIVAGDKIKITAAPKGFGSENMSRLRMFTQVQKGKILLLLLLIPLKQLVLIRVRRLLSALVSAEILNIVLFLRKKHSAALFSKRNGVEFYRDMEKNFDKINSLDIGPQGFGGRTTALAVNIETYPTHIAGLPVAVNVGCHVTRHASKVI